MTQIKTFSELGRFIIYHVYDIMDKLENPSHLINYPDLKKQIGERIQNDPRCQNPFVMHEYTSHHVFDTALHHHWNMGKPNTYRWETVMDFYISQQHRAFCLQHVYNYRVKEPVDYIHYMNSMLPPKNPKGEYVDMVERARFRRGKRPLRADCLSYSEISAYLQKQYGQ